MSSPRRPATRQTFPDQLRGLALLGIIVVNAPFLAISSDGYTAASIAAPIDWAAAFSVTLLTQGKFYLIFSFLFGYSANFIVRSTAQRAAAVPSSAPRVGCDRPGPRRVPLHRRHPAVLRAAGLACCCCSAGAIARYCEPGRSPGWSPRPGLGHWSCSPPTWGNSAPTRALNWMRLAKGSFVEAAVARAQALPAGLLLVGTLQWGMAFSASPGPGRRSSLALRPCGAPAPCGAGWRSGDWGSGCPCRRCCVADVGGGDR